MYLIIGTSEVKVNLENMLQFFASKNMKADIAIKQNTKDVVFFVEKNWKKYERVIILDQDGIFPFMYLSKVHKLVVATITDVYSAYMTPLHNNTKVIIIPTSIVAEDLANKLAKYFIDAEFEAGRHMVRIDMLDKETE